MSCFRGQMQEYTNIAIDRFDGKNLRCTIYFLSHCHTDHMVGLKDPYFAESLRSRNGVFLYCSEITRLLLLADNDYSQLTDYIHTLKVGVSQPVRVPSNTLAEEYYVNVTPLSAGHCPGSVMFLFEGHEGTSLYTGDFRWEINHAASVSAFKQDNRLKEIKSVYIDTTFCIPEAYHIPTRRECVDATVTLVSSWLQHSPLHVVLMNCPAKYGYEHLLMELSRRLNIKIHVPEWKIKIYDQIPNLKNVFTCDSDQARIHACSQKKGWMSSLPCQKSSEKGKRFCVLHLRPSAMWFTSEKFTAETGDLVVVPTTPKGLYRVCYSMHSSYSEVRDLVSYLKPDHVYPNVVPASDTGMKQVMARLNSFLEHPNKLRITPSADETHFQPLGVLRNRIPVQRRTHLQLWEQGTKDFDEPVFSSPETDTGKGGVESGTNSGQIVIQNGSEQVDVCDKSSAGKKLAVSCQDTVTTSEETLLFPEEETVVNIAEGLCSKTSNGCNATGGSDSSKMRSNSIYNTGVTSCSTESVCDDIPKNDKIVNKAADIELVLPAVSLEQKKLLSTDICTNDCVDELDASDRNYEQQNLFESCFVQKMKETSQKDENKIQPSSCDNKVLNTVAENASAEDFSEANNDRSCGDNDFQDQTTDSDDIVFNSQGSSNEAPSKFHISIKTILKPHQTFQSEDNPDRNASTCVIQEDGVNKTEGSEHEVITILSSQSSQESQSFWCANNLSRENGYSPEKHTQCIVVKDEICISKIDLSNDLDNSVKKDVTNARRKTLHITSEERSHQSHLETKDKINVKNNHTILKRKFPSLESINLLHSEDLLGMKRIRNDVENKLVACGSEAKSSDLFGCKCNISQFDQAALNSDTALEYASNSRCAAKRDNNAALSNFHSHGGRDFKEYGCQDVAAASQDSVWIDLTSDTVIDLTLDNFH